MREFWGFFNPLLVNVVYGCPLISIIVTDLISICGKRGNSGNTGNVSFSGCSRSGHVTLLQCPNQFLLLSLFYFNSSHWIQRLLASPVPEEGRTRIEIELFPKHIMSRPPLVFVLPDKQRKTLHMNSPFYLQGGPAKMGIFI